MAAGEIALVITALLGTGGVGALLMHWRRERRRDMRTRAIARQAALDFTRKHYEQMLETQAKIHAAEMERVLARLRACEGKLNGRRPDDGVC